MKSYKQINHEKDLYIRVEQVELNGCSHGNDIIISYIPTESNNVSREDCNITINPTNEWITINYFGETFKYRNIWELVNALKKEKLWDNRGK